MYDDIAVARLQQELDALPVIQQPELHPIDQSGNIKIILA